MKVLLLLAGRSRRFWPLQEKTLFPICGKTLLEHQIGRLNSVGLTDIILVGGEHNLEEAEGLFPQLKRIEQENLDLGMRGALLSALPACGDEAVMIVSGNDVIDPSAYAGIKEESEQDGVQGALLAQKVESYFPGGYIALDGKKIASIIEKPGKGNEPSDLVNIVAHAHNSASMLLDALQDVDESTDDGYEQALQKLFDAHTYHAVSYDGVWQAVKFPWHLLQVLPIFLEEISEQSIHPSAQIHPTAVVEGNVVIEEGVRVLPHASIIGPCYIGKDTIVANNSLTRGSSVGEHCVVGFATEVKGSIFHSDVWTHMNYVGDSVIGNNVSLGGGTTTGNLRLDEESILSVVDGDKVDTGLVKLGTIIGNNCRLGAQVTTNPGIKIGSDSFVSSACLIEEDIPSGQFARMKEGALKVSENKTETTTADDREKFRKKI